MNSVIKITLHPGTYVIAVSGGIDSVVLLDVLSQQLKAGNEIQPTRLIVAHFDHGIRNDSHKDRQFVAELAKQYGHPFVYGVAQLGSTASEDSARQARYQFLRKAMVSVDGCAIVTGHHQDDARETAIFNLLRGTGRHGVIMREKSGDIWRPLLAYDKNSLLVYAKAHHLRWREDSTNQDTKYSRNYIRNVLLKRLNAAQREELDGYLFNVVQLDTEIEARLACLMHLQPSVHQINRQQFSALPHSVAKEFMVYWLRNNRIRDFDKPMIERLCVAVKTGYPGKQYDITKGKSIALSKQTASLKLLS